MFVYLFKTTCLPNGRIYWGIHQSDDLLFDVPRNQSVAWPQNRLFMDDFRQYGPNAFHHQVVTAKPATDLPLMEKEQLRLINATPEHLRYNLFSLAQRERTPEELEEVRSFTFITNGKETKRYKKDQPIPKGWILGNGNLMTGKQRAEIRVRLRNERKGITNEDGSTNPIREQIESNSIVEDCSIGKVTLTESNSSENTI